MFGDVLGSFPREARNAVSNYCAEIAAAQARLAHALELVATEKRTIALYRKFDLSVVAAEAALASFRALEASARADLARLAGRLEGRGQL